MTPWALQEIPHDSCVSHLLVVQRRARMLIKFPGLLLNDLAGRRLIIDS